LLAARFFLTTILRVVFFLLPVSVLRVCWRKTPKNHRHSFILSSVAPQERARRACSQGPHSAPILADGQALRGESALGLSVLDWATEE